MKSIPDQHKKRCADRLSNMPPAIAMMFTATETPTQEDRRLRIGKRWADFSAWLDEYRKENKAEPSQITCDEKYDELTKKYSL